MPGIDRCARILELVRRLGRWATIGELAAERGTALKTARRDIAYLQRLGFRLHVRVEKFGAKRYRLNRPAALRLLGLHRGGDGSLQ